MAVIQFALLTDFAGPCATGSVSYSTAMVTGQNIGTCITAIPQ